MRDSDDATVAPAVDRIRSRTNAAEMSPIIASAPPLHCTDAVTGCSMSEGAGAGAGASSVFAYVCIPSQILKWKVVMKSGDLVMTWLNSLADSFRSSSMSASKSTCVSMGMA